MVKDIGARSVWSRHKWGSIYIRSAQKN